MAGGMDLGGSGKGKRSLDAALNLVPFIDLMAVTIVFLIMTAVWTQLGSLKAQRAGADGPPPDTAQPEVVLALNAQGAALFVAEQPFATVPLSRDADGKLTVLELGRRLDELKAQLPEQLAVTVRAEDDRSYDDLVRVMDACIASRLPSVTLEPSR